MRNLSIIIITLLPITVFATDDLKSKLIGNWCLNTEKYADEITVDGSKWSFKKDGTYSYKQAYVSEDKYYIKGDTIKLNNYGTMKILSINDKEMIGEIYSTYHFTRNKCLPLVRDAEQVTKLNNAIIKKDMKMVKSLVKSGVNINVPDRRSSGASTPLIIAVKFGGKEFVEYILSLKPDLNITDGQGRTAMDVAKKSKQQDIINLIENAAKKK